MGGWGGGGGAAINSRGECGRGGRGGVGQRPWVGDGEVGPGWVTTVSGALDHGASHGGGISRFLADVASVLEEPALLRD